MSTVIEGAVKALNDRLQGFDGSARFVIEGEGEVVVDENGARPADGAEETDVTLTADRDTFEGMIDGSVNPTAAFMTGKLKVDGDMGTAMRLGSALG